MVFRFMTSGSIKSCPVGIAMCQHAGPLENGLCRLPATFPRPQP